jgi:uncharacterized protein (TIGR03435 family)
MLIRTAYNVQEDQVVAGRDWIDSLKFDDSVKSADGVPLTAIGAELQSSLRRTRTSVSENRAARLKTA